MNLFIDNHDKVDFDEIITSVTVWVNAVLGVLVILAVLFAVIKTIYIWVSVIRTSDEPNVRSQLLASLKWPLISIISMLVVIGLANVLIVIVKSSVVQINTGALFLGGVYG